MYVGNGIPQRMFVFFWLGFITYVIIHEIFFLLTEIGIQFLWTNE